MKLHIAKIKRPYEDEYSIVGVYTSEEKAKEAITKETVEYYRLVGDSRLQPLGDIEEHELDE